jgi:hypothetical protein
MKFAIYQIQITDEQIDLINSTGDFGAVPAKKAQLDMQMDFSGNKIGGLASDAWDAGYYTHVANIEADNYNEVFEIGNIGPEENIERLTRMSSISVGDVIVGEDGTVAVVASVGFVAFGFNPKMAA